MAKFQMKRKGRGLWSSLAKRRNSIQLFATFLTNIHLPNFLQGVLYNGKVKQVCVPGLNCYSCPGATGSCPVGSFQAVVGSSKFNFSYYITGLLIFFGIMLGRFICGFLCPFGWFQDLLHKIKSTTLPKVWCPTHYSCSTSYIANQQRRYWFTIFL